jgi:hypothetical protein
MQYLMLNPGAQQALLQALADMPRCLERAFEALSDEDAATPGANGAFSPVEHAWHLADLEREGYSVRIARLRGEAAPQLSDFAAMMAEHDAGHRSEIDAWLRGRRPS